MKGREDFLAAVDRVLTRPEDRAYFRIRLQKVEREGRGVRGFLAVGMPYEIGLGRNLDTGEDYVLGTISYGGVDIVSHMWGREPEPIDPEKVRRELKEGVLV